jgi:hypothetical protein
MRNFIRWSVVISLSLVSLTACSSGPTTRPNAVATGTFTQDGQTVNFHFKDTSASPKDDSFTGTWSGVTSGSFSGGNSISGSYDVSTDVSGPGPLTIRIVLANKKGSSLPFSATFTPSGPRPVKGLSVKQSSGSTDVEVSWDAPSSGPNPSSYLVSWSGSQSGRETTSELSYTISASAGNKLQVSVVSIISSFPKSTPVTKSISITQPWYTSPDDSTLSYKYLDPNQYSCQSFAEYGCGKIVVTASSSCFAGIYAEANHLDSNGAVIGYANDTLSALAADQIGYLEFDFTDSGSSYQVTKLHCE